MRIGTVVAIAAAFIPCWATAAGAQSPAVIWVSQPVEPGETVMVYGGPWTDVKAIELSGPERRTVRPLKATDDCLNFVYPADWPLAAFTARVTSGASGSVEFRVNALDVWWLQGDAGPSASPGGWLRAFGRSIGYNKGAVLELRSAGRVNKLPAADCDRFSLRVELPKDLPAGRYEVFLNNGLDEQPVSAGRIEIAPYKESWPEKIFNVVDYGAVPNDANDDSRAVHAALADIAANGGGVLYFPRGRYGMRGTLELPPHTLLRGEDMTLSQIYWLDEDAPKGPLVSGKHHFGIENIFLVAGNVDEGIVVIPPEKDDHWKNESVLLRRVRARFLHTDNSTAEESFRRSQAGGMPLRIAGKFIRVVDCDFYFSKGDTAVSGDYLLASGNRFEGPGCGYLGGRCCIFENNNSEGRGMSFANGTRCFYLKGNRIGGVYGDGDRETFTFDGGDPAYADTVVSAAGRTVRLKPGGWRHGPEIWVDRPIFIVGGKGAGQMRFITRVDGRDVEIDRPWDIQPDADSYFAIAQVRSKLLFVDNHDRDGNPFAMYGSAVDAVVAGNTLERTGGLHAHGMFKGAPEPSWFIQFLGNQIVEGNSVRGPFSFVVPAADSWLGFFDRGIRKPLTYPENRVGIMRRNMLESNAFLDSFGRVKNLLVENNLVRNADKGVVIGPDVQDAILRGNRFDNVIRPYNVNDRTLVSPADRLLAGLSAAAVLKPGLPDDWGQFISAAEALAKQDLPEAEAARAAADILNRAARALSAKVGDRPISSATVAALFGLDLSQSSPWLFGRILPNKTNKIPIGIAYPAWSLAATLTASTAGIEGWQVRVDTPVKLVPGKNGACGVWITRPDGPPALFTLPVEYEIAGDGWKFKFHERYSWDNLDVTELLVAGPFKNASGKPLDPEVHPPEIRLDVTAAYDTLDGQRPWVPVKADAAGVADLCKVFKNTEMATAHAVAVVRAARALQVKVVGGGPNSLVFVNGQRIGSSARRDAPRCVDLHPGENLLHLISSHGTGPWPVGFKLSAVDPVKPGDLQVVPAEGLAKTLAASQGERIPQGKGLPNSLDVDWKLLASDDFNRSRLGSGWKCQSPSWMTQNACIIEGALASEAGWGFLTFDQEITSPVRIEFDMLAKGSMGGVTLSPKGLAWRNFWGNLAGRGYCLSLGWHDAKNNRLLRDVEAVVLDEKGRPPEPGQWCHVTAQFVSPRCQLYVDGKLTLDYQDPAFLPGLDRIGLFTLGGSRFDNVRIYTSREK
jgi:hypothetical protein